MEFINNQTQGIAPKKNKCEEAGFIHAWENTTPNTVYPTYPPQYPNKQETCKNCGLVREHHERTEHWISYSDGRMRSDSNLPTN